MKWLLVRAVAVLVLSFGLLVGLGSQSSATNSSQQFCPAPLFPGEPIPSPLTGTPATMEFANGNPNVFIEGVNGSLWNFQYITTTLSNGCPAFGGWFDSELLSGGLASAPAVVSQPNGNASVFFEGAGGALWNYWFDNGTWYEAEIATRGIASSPAVMNQQDGAPSVFVQGVNGSLWNYWYDSGTWGVAEIASSGISSAPAVVSQANGAPSVFVQDAGLNSGGEALFNYFYIPSTGAWGAGTVAGTASALGMPSVIVQPSQNDAPSVFVQGLDDSLANYVYVPSVGSWELGLYTFAAFSTPGVTLQSNGDPSVIAEGPDHSLLNYWYVPDETSWYWASGTVANDGSAYSTPGLVLQPDGLPSVFVVGPGGSLWNYWYANGGWDEAQLS